jgi:hypothetical protein
MKGNVLRVSFSALGLVIIPTSYTFAALRPWHVRRGATRFLVGCQTPTVPRVDPWWNERRLPKPSGSPPPNTFPDRQGRSQPGFSPNTPSRWSLQQIGEGLQSGGQAQKRFGNLPSSSLRVAKPA